MKKTCINCGKEYDYEFEEDIFTCENGILSYDNFDKDYCAECALEAAENPDYGDYHEECEECGNRFDLADEISIYMNNTRVIDDSLENLWSQAGKIMCASCALEFENEQLAKLDC